VGPALDREGEAGAASRGSPNGAQGRDVHGHVLGEDLDEEALPRGPDHALAPTRPAATTKDPRGKSEGGDGASAMMRQP
jgi:hypothetical protein